MPHKTLFISDLHLDPRLPALSEAFVEFIEKNAFDADALYILGDFFEVWLGDDDLNPHHFRILDTLRKLSNADVKVYFMRGNRDFLINKHFAAITGATLLPDPATITLYGKPVLLSHGDLLCTLDIKHQRSRNFYTNKLVQFVARNLPLRYRRYKANKFRSNSAGTLKNLPAEIMDVTQSAVEETMAKHNVDLLIHGHTHRPDIHHFKLNNEPATRIVLGSWHHGVHCLEYYDDGNYQFITEALSTP